ncbi:MAG: hypothetical protein LBT77_02340 [Mycoplasmataceae bacterium]|nr:hypothetical protein [Mycoplasmataceae bacterium]
MFGDKYLIIPNNTITIGKYAFSIDAMGLISDLEIPGSAFIDTDYLFLKLLFCHWFTFWRNVLFASFMKRL